MGDPHTHNFCSRLKLSITGCNVNLLISLIISRVVIQSIEHKRVLVQACRLSNLSVSLSFGLSVRWVNRGKTADCIWMLFGVVIRVGRGMSVLDGTGDRPKGRGNFKGEFGASHCN